MRRLGPDRLALVPAATAAAAAPASAADMEAAAFPPAYLPAIYDWTGLHLGGHAGINYRFNWSGGGAFAARY